MAFYIIEVVEKRYVLAESDSERNAIDQAEEFAVSDLDNDELEIQVKGDYKSKDNAYDRWGINIDLTEED